MDSMDEERQLIRKGLLGISGAGTRGSELWFSPFFLPQYNGVADCITVPCG